MLALIVLVVVIAVLSGAFALYGLTTGAAGYLLFFGLLLGAVVVFSLIAAAMTMSMPGTTPPDDHRQ